MRKSWDDKHPMSRCSSLQPGELRCASSAGIRAQLLPAERGCNKQGQETAKNRASAQEERRSTGRKPEEHTHQREVGEVGVGLQEAHQGRFDVIGQAVACTQAQQKNHEGEETKRRAEKGARQDRSREVMLLLSCMQRKTSARSTSREKLPVEDGADGKWEREGSSQKKREKKAGPTAIHRTGSGSGATARCR